MKFNKIISVICAAAVLGCTVPFSEVPERANTLVSSAEETPSVTFRAIGQSTQMTLSGNTEVPEWYSDNTNVAVVDQNGKITAVGEGTCKVYAVFSEQVLECIVNVEIPEEQTEFLLGEFTLTNDKPAIELSPTGGDMTGAVWSSSDEKVAKVDQKGTVTAVGKGSCVISFVVGGKTYKVNITSEYTPQQTTTAPVTEKVIGSVELSNEKNTASISPKDIPEGTEISWSSDNEKVAKVDKNGVITAVGAGSCKIIALIQGVKYITNVKSTFDPNYIPTKPADVSLGKLELSNDASVQKILLNGTDKDTEIKWSSSDTSVAEVDNEGTVTAKGSGNCRINAVIDGVTYYMEVTSTYKPSAEPVLNAPADTIEKAGETLQLTVKNTDKEVEWISTNVNVLTVDKNGLVTAVGAGSAEIIAKTEGKVMRLTITVKGEASADIVYGDADLDGNVTINDAVAVMSFVANSKKYPLSAEGINNADVYCRGDLLSNMDALSIQKFKAGIIDKLPE